MMRKVLIALVSLAHVEAVQLLVASYKPESSTTGAIQTLDLQVNGNNASLKVTSTNSDCGASPSWLDVSTSDRVTCVDEAEAGGLTMLTIKPDGSLEKKTNTTTLGGPVSSVRYNNGSAVALAHYGPVAAISTFKLDSNNAYLPMQNLTFNISGSASERQKTSHMHQAVLDPTGQYLLSPDLGGNVIQVLSIDSTTGSLVAKAPLKSPAGAGPRHLAFWSTNSTSASTFMSVVHELKNTITTYKVIYDCEGLSFDQVDEVSTYGPNTTVAAAAAAAEIIKSPDSRFIMVSNRLNPIDVASPEPGNTTQIKNDSLATFRLMENGTLGFVELHASGGLNPRHFSLNGNGTLVAVANQMSKSVVIWRRDVATGKLSEKPAASVFAGPGELTNVQWLE